jgi:hypothetical protein
MKHLSTCSGCPVCRPEFARLLEMAPSDYAEYLKARTRADRMRSASHAELRTSVHVVTSSTRQSTAEATMTHKMKQRFARLNAANGKQTSVAALEGKRNSATDQAHWNGVHDAAVKAVATDPSDDTVKALIDVHKHAIAGGADNCGPDCPMAMAVPDDTTQNDNAKNLSASYIAPDPYAAGVAAMRAARSHTPVVLSAAERTALGPYANDVARMRSLNR